ncbi:Protein-tyrosine phosphatase RolB [Dissostichus eleginoides]|uniref:Protein-tyrosine phosphatase RolB n=1 Tax=Dissostichus eleginoides TaxID=100907 RepID=A0AAD9F8W4_DISEL|nr:Protein-tyrosine phosphatase RolB [Dissostichus eleginoides]
MRDTCLPPVPSAPLSAIPKPLCACSVLFLTHKDLHRMERSHSYNYSNKKTRTEDLEEEILCSSSAIFASSLERKDVFDLSKRKSACATVVFYRKI